MVNPCQPRSSNGRAAERVESADGGAAIRLTDDWCWSKCVHVSSGD